MSRAATDPSADGALRPIWLCADDYGIAPGVSRGIRELIARGRLNATSVMTVAPSMDEAEARALLALQASQPGLAIGLHVTLTGRFAPCSPGYRPTRHGTFLGLAEMMVRGRLHLLDPARLVGEIEAQLDAFVALFGRAPDYFDGHQHSHLFPQIREALLDVVRRRVPQAWVRQCGRAPTLPRPYADYKALILDGLGRRFTALAAARGVATNPAFAGAYDFTAAGEVDFPKLFPRFLMELPAGSVVMCHPGFVDAELERLDPLTAQREREYAYLAGDELPRALAAQGLRLG